MNGKKFAKFSISLTLVLLILVGAFQIVIDPLFQYHQPWFGLKPVVTDERYHNPGIAKTFDYDNVVLGNSMSENFYISDVDDVFGGNSVKLTMSGSGCYEWSYLLEIIKDRKPKNILINIDPLVFERPSNEFRFEIPYYLYDSNLLNDVNYLFNFSIINSFTQNSIYQNYNSTVPDFNRVYSWYDGTDFSKEVVLENYVRSDINRIINTNEISDYQKNITKNFSLLTPYFQLMPDTNFVFYFSPYSMLFWDNEKRKNCLEKQNAGFLRACEVLTSFDNVELYLWEDNEMLKIMSDLNNYKDYRHYSEDINKVILKRVKQKNGLINKSNYLNKVKILFQYFKNYNYDDLFI